MSDLKPGDEVWVRAEVTDTTTAWVNLEVSDGIDTVHVRFHRDYVYPKDHILPAAPADLRARDYHGDLCPMCGEAINSLGGDPGQWAVVLPHGEPGCSAAFHMGCVYERVQAAETMRAMAEEIRDNDYADKVGLLITAGETNRIAAILRALAAYSEGGE